MAKKNLAFFTSAQGGLSHYSTHLYLPAKEYFNPFYVTYADSVVDDLVEKYVGKVESLIRKEDPASVLMTLKFLKDNDIKFINFNIATTARKTYFHYVALLSKAQLMGIKVVATMHDVMPFESFYIDPAAMELLYSCVDHYIVGNQAEKDKLQLYFRVPENRITVIQHGPYTLFDTKTFSKETAREHLGIPKGKKVILFFGNLRPHKGLKFLIKAFKNVVKTNPDAWLYISADLKYSPESNDMLQRIEKSGISDKTQIVKKYVPSSEIEPIFKAADIVVLPYTMVSQSGILNLAYAFKKPIVVTDIFPDATAIDHKMGLVVKTGDIKSLEESIVDLLHRPQSELEEMGQAGFDFATSHASWEQAAKQLYEICEKVE